MRDGNFWSITARKTSSTCIVSIATTRTAAALQPSLLVCTVIETPSLQHIYCPRGLALHFPPQHHRSPACPTTIQSPNTDICPLAQNPLCVRIAERASIRAQPSLTSTSYHSCVPISVLTASRARNNCWRHERGHLHLAWRLWLPRLRIKIPVSNIS